MKRIGGSALAVAALAGAAASPAAAMIGPACSARLVAGTTGSCSFDAPYDYASFSVVPAGGPVTATLRCFTSYGSTYTWTRTVSQSSSWSGWSPGSCSLSLSGASPTSAVGAATPTFGPIVEPPPPAY